MVYNELEQEDILSAVRVGLAPIAYTDILLRSIWAMHKKRQSPVGYFPHAQVLVVALVAQATRRQRDRRAKETGRDP
jgi:hypothetical protein